MDEATCDKEQEVGYCSSGNVTVSTNTKEWADKPLIYISGPMMSEGHAYVNISHAIVAGHYARSRGWAVIIPQLDCLYSMVTGITDREHYMDNDLNLLSRCDAVLVLPYKVEISNGQQTGTSEELDFAEDHNIPIYTLETLPLASDFDRDEEGFTCH